MIEALSAAWQRPAVRSLRAWAVVSGSAVVGVRLIGGGAVIPWAIAVAVLVVAVARVRRGIAGGVPREQLPAAIVVTLGWGVVGAYTVGAPLIAAMERRHGPVWGELLVMVAALVVAMRLKVPEPRFGDTSLARASESSPKLLEVRGVDFGYGRLQVLHNVDFAVGEGEMVALLGVNGAGKSTLLRAISGLGVPTAGAITFGGEDITYLGVEARVRRGITQVPGGRAVFGPLSVVDNLRSYAYSLDRTKTNAAIDRVLGTFPRLEERRNQNAETLSGGEQQMLALAKAVMLEPKLLLIDELSLGLAPIIVAQLLEIVRTINATGTAVVLVEQSVNIALNLADHAFFMERGAVQFDGKSKDLLGRDDLLRAVFLEGSKAR